jgi:hypothetical protein
MEIDKMSANKLGSLPFKQALVPSQVGMFFDLLIQLFCHFN